MTQEDLPSSYAGQHNPVKINFSQLPFIVKFLTYWIFLKFIFWVLLVCAYAVLVAVNEKSALVMLAAILK
jgi:hypothetical protein